MVAQELALLCPERLASLCLINTYASIWGAIPNPAAVWRLLQATGLTGEKAAGRLKAGLRLLFSEGVLDKEQPSELHEGKMMPNTAIVRKAMILRSLDVP